MEKHTVKTTRKYIIATLSSPTQYLISQHWGKWAFTDNIELATKTKTREVAKIVKANYHHDFGVDIDLVIIPVDIEYKMIKEYEE